MAEEHNPTVETNEVEDRGLLDFVSKKEEKADEEVLAGLKNLQIKDEKLEDEKKDTLLDKLYSSDGSGLSSLSDEADTVVVTQKAVVVEEVDDSTIAVDNVESEAVLATPKVLGEEEKEECLEEILEKLQEDKKILEEGPVESIAPEVKEGALESTTPPSPALAEEKEECLEEMMEKLQEHKKSLEEGAVETIAPEVKEGAVESTALPPPALAVEKEECLEEMMEKLEEHKKTLEEGAVESIAPEVKEGAVEFAAPPPPALSVEPEGEKLPEHKKTPDEGAVESIAPPPPAPAVEKEECLDETTEKLPEHKKTPEEGAVEPIAPPPQAPVGEPEVEKKSFLAKIKEIIPGYHKSSGEDGVKAAAASE